MSPSRARAGILFLWDSKIWSAWPSVEVLPHLHPGRVWSEQCFTIPDERWFLRYRRSRETSWSLLDQFADQGLLRFLLEIKNWLQKKYDRTSFWVSFGTIVVAKLKCVFGVGAKVSFLWGAFCMDVRHLLTSSHLQITGYCIAKSG